uniref:O-acyl-ADP-ribose deacylase 1 n=1 Tax=Amphiprion percula TaxID=161767 RepID=A0A3P8UEH5_AMPPE
MSPTDLSEKSTTDNFTQSHNPSRKLLKQVTSNLFDCPNDEALVHCISGDCCMGASIAVLFKQKFGDVSKLLKQRKVSGQCAVLLRESRFIYYLVYANCTRFDLSCFLSDYVGLCDQNLYKHVSCSSIVCGLDQLEWTKVAKILEQVFIGTGIIITIYSLPWTAQKENVRKTN